MTCRCSRTCLDCEREIPANRLAARPDAQYCCACQTARDLYITEADVPGMAVMGEIDVREVLHR